MPLTLNINNAQVVKFTNRLEKLHKSGLPVAIRETLNETAFNTKRDIPKEASRHFTIRSPNFFRVFSKVQKAKGFNVKTMRSIAGMTDRRPGGSSEQAGRNMVQRQRGGRIGGRSFIPTDQARFAKSQSRKVRPQNRISALNLDKLIDSSDVSQGTERQSFIKSAIFAFKRDGPGALLRHKGRDGKVRIYRVKRVRTKGGIKVDATPIYTYVSGRSVQAGKVVAFTFISGRRNQLKMNRIFERQAKRQIRRLKNK